MAQYPVGSAPGPVAAPHQQEEVAQSYKVAKETTTPEVNLTYLREFTRQRPPFVGKLDPLRAEELMMKVEKILDTVILGDVNRVRLTTLV